MARTQFKKLYSSYCATLTCIYAGTCTYTNNNKMPPVFRYAAHLFTVTQVMLS